jgi:phenylacetate-CoA ligase
MENRLTRAVYDHSPVLLQHACTSAFGLHKRLRRFTRAFRRWRRFYSESARWPLDQLRAYQDQKVRQVIRHAYDTTRFYRELMDGLHLRPDDIRTVADLPKLPVIEKSRVRQAGPGAMLSSAVPARKLRSAPTSGSTGFPITNYWVADTEQREYGFHWARRREGVRRGDSYGSFTGLQLLPADSLRPPFWRFNWAAHQTCYSIFHIAPETIPLYLGQMQRARHVYLEGYPSVVAMLGKYILDHGIDWPCPPRAMFTEAEQLLDEHRLWIEQGFKTRVHNQYGMSEMAGSITQYSCGHMHYDMDYAVIEFLPVGVEDGYAVAEMICTAFDNPAYPLVRYRIGDLAILPAEPVACDHVAGPVVAGIYGRSAHSLISRDGRRINNISVIVKRCRHVDMVQCVQHEVGKVQVRVLRAAGYSRDDEAGLLDQFARKMGQMEFQLIYVDSSEQMERTSRGKFLSIISRLPAPQSQRAP